MDVTTNYKPHVDGLRAVAVLAVLIFHARLEVFGHPLLGGGYVGVDVFFVISGYLITGIILKDLGSDEFSILQFWERRVRRILPALVVVVLVSLLAGWCLYLPDDFAALGKSAIAQSALISNVYFWRDAGYFAPASETKPLLHTWSLAVEEQYYLLFPWFLVLTYRTNLKRLLGGLASLGILSFTLSCYGALRYPDTAFYLLPFRAWELILGSLVAGTQARANAKPLPSGWPEVLSFTGLLAIALAMFGYDANTRIPGAPALPCLGTAFILWSNTQNKTLVGRMLSIRPLVFIGLISYSLYLWHWPLLVFGQYWKDNASSGYRLYFLLGSLAVAYLSWKYIETPFRQRTMLRERPRLFIYAALATILVALVGIGIVFWDGGPTRIQNKAMVYVQQKRDANHSRGRTMVSLDSALAGSFIPLGLRDPNQALSFMIWGDSHASMLIPILEDMCTKYALRGIMAAHSASPPILDRNNRPVYQNYLKNDFSRYSAAVVDYIRSQHIQDVIMIARWHGYSQKLDKVLLREDLYYTIDTLNNAGVRVWVVKQIPEQVTDPVRQLAWASITGGETDQLGVSLIEHQKKYIACDNDLLDGLRPPRATVLDPTAVFFNTKGYCQLESGGKLIFYDRDHLTDFGTQSLVPVLAPMFESISRRRDGN